ncbi:MAG: hypothetical protein KA740_14850 [Rhodoferax sp.]|nr:hypothetical protein [Rhodoferax sp.]
MKFLNPIGKFWPASRWMMNSGAAALLAAVMSLVPDHAVAATKTFNLKWSHSENPKDSFTGTLKLDTDLLPNSGMVNLATTTASFSVTVPQLGGATYAMADFSTFSVGMSKADMVKATPGQELMGKGLVTQLLIYGKMGGPAHKKFNACGGEFGICFNREAAPPVYKLVSITVGK